MPDRRRQENKKPEPGFLPNPTPRPEAAVVGSTSAGEADPSSSVSTHSPSSSHLVPSTNTNPGIPVTYRSSNTVHHFGTAQQILPTPQTHQVQQVQQSPQIQQPLFETGYFQIPQLRLNFIEPVNLPTIYGNHNGQDIPTTTSASIPNPVGTVQTNRRNLSIPLSQARVAPTSTAYPIPVPSSYTSSTGRSDQHQPNPLYNNGFGNNCHPGRRSNLYPCGPEVLVGLGQQHEYRLPEGQLSLSPNSFIAHANNALYHQQFDCLSIQPAHSNGIHPSQAHQYQPLIPNPNNTLVPQRDALANSNVVDFAQLHHLSCLAAKRSAEERESLNQTRRAFFAATDITEIQTDLLRSEAISRTRRNRAPRMANGTLRVKQETLNCGSSPEDSGDQVLDLRKSTSEKLCVWCGKKSSVGEDGVESEFCSEICFDQYRRDSFKKRAACMWCNNANHGMINLSLISTLDESKFCSDQCLTQFKVRLFCEETSAHLEQLKEIQLNGGLSRSNHSAPRQAALPMGNELITPELWLRKQPGHPNSKKGSPGHVSSPNHTISSGCNSPAGSPQSSQHSNSPTIVPNPHHIQNQNHHRITAQVPSQIFATLAIDGASNGSRESRRRVISPPNRNTAPPANKEKSVSQRKRFKSSCSVSANHRGLTSQALQQQLLLAATANQGIAVNGNMNVVNNPHHSRSRISNASFTSTSGTPTQLVNTNQIPIGGSPRHAATVMNGNVISPLIPPAFLSGLMSGNQNQVASSLERSSAVGLQLSIENGFSPAATNGTANLIHNPTIVVNPIPLPSPIQLQTIMPQIPAGNPTSVSISTQTEPSTPENQSMNGGALWNNFPTLPPVTVLVPFPIPFPLPIPIPIFLGDYANWSKLITKAAPIPSTSSNGDKVETAVSDTKIKKVLKEDEMNNGGVDETVEEGEIVGNSEEETIEEQKPPTDDEPSDTKTD